ncbi:MAG: MarC family protein, partial [Lentisphaeraceae bacterium]|nr:MarC family protein [Lentisphaeraceae bacterium]
LFPNKNNAEEESVDDPFIVPLAMPLIACPSTIAVLLLMSSTEPEKMAEWSSSLLIAWSATAAILILSPFFIKYLGKRGITAIERLMGMLLILIAIQMFLNGLTQYVKTLMAG